MAKRTLNQLSDAKVKALPPGKHKDGGSLYMNVTPQGTRSWLFIFVRNGRRREAGLGSYPAVSLAKARQRAQQYRELLADGRDPIEERRAEVAVPTFQKAAEQYLKSVGEEWTSAKHRADSKRMLGPQYCKPILDMRVNTIDVADVLRVLTPIWNTKRVTASRVRRMLESVFDLCRAHSWLKGKNPASWEELPKHMRPKRGKSRGRREHKHKHHAAMEHQRIPAFMEKLREAEGMGHRALEFTILTAARSGEVLGATWSEIDLDAKLWTVPPERMKNGEAHDVPLVGRALEIVQELSEARLSDFVFPGVKEKRPLAHMTLLLALRGMGEKSATVHGFRSTFRDWAGDKTTHQREVAEACLAHKIGDGTEQAYRRGNAPEKRRSLLKDWSDYLSGAADAGEAVNAA